MSLNRFFLTSSLVTTTRGLERAREASSEAVVMRSTWLMDIWVAWTQETLISHTTDISW